MTGIATEGLNNAEHEEPFQNPQGNALDVARIRSKIGIEIIDDDDDIGAEGDVDKTLENIPPPPPRDQWGSKISYMLTLVGYAVGFGNIWRFPYQVRDNGGLAFMIPYCFMLAVVGIPIFFMELAVGQRRRTGVVYAWNEISPWFGGLGICCGWLCFMIGLYYNTLIAYCMSYFVDSFRNPLPWTSCSKVGSVADINECNQYLESRATKYYWNRKTLGISTGIDDIGGYNFWLLLYHIVAWVAIWGILWKGTKSVGYVVYVTAVFPYVVLMAFFIGNLVIEPKKAWLGAYRLVIPDWQLLLSPITWLKAGSQIFFSLGLALGCLVVFASYSPERNNCHRDAVLISLINCGTSVFAALVVFPIIGALGVRNYENCLQVMRNMFPELQELKKDDKNYDIYFSTTATNWAMVSPANPIKVRYGIGELTDDQKMDFQTSRDQELFETITNLALANYPSTIPIAKALKDCSIGKEATASGGGTGFVFIGFTEAVLRMPGSNFWALLFFLMLLTLGIDSAFGTVEGAVAAIEDLTKLSRFTATTITCTVMAILAVLLFPFGYGSYVLDLIDQWTANWTLLLVAFAQCVAVSWFYGLAKFSYDVKLMTGNKPNLYMLACWKYISPAVIILLLVGSVASFIYTTVKEGGIKYTTFRLDNSNSNGGDYKTNMPAGALLIGFLLMFFCMSWLPIHILLRNTRFKILKEQAPADFPEEELRGERNINVKKEEDQFSTTEKAIMGKQSLMNLQEHRDKVKSSNSQTSIQKRGSGGASLGSRL